MTGLFKLLMNIIKNAIQFKEDGLIFLRGTLENGETIIEEEEIGIGIAAEEVQHIL
ncbi:hypothetical protein BN2127_JRS3_01751 [Bacillus safensis]|nr:hypothetical protein BN2127_JRS3_01751 [Bacillus safensis]